MRVLSLAVAALLGACALGPEHETPAQNTPEDYYLVEQRSAPQADNLAAMQWQQIYVDTELSGFLNTALANNPDLQTARLQLARAEAARRVARAPLFPHINANAGAEREQKSEQDSPGSAPIDEYTLGLGVSWELDLWGVNRRAAERADAELDAARFSHYDVQVALIAAVATTYFDLLDAHNRLLITQDTVSAREKALRILELRKQGGIISGLDVRQAEVALAQARSRVPALEDEILALENSFNLLLGRAPQALPLTRTLGDMALPDQLPVGLPAELLQRRPDIRAADARLHSATAGIGVAKGALFPRIQLTGSIGQTSNELDTLLQSSANGWTLAGSLLQPVFNSGANLANLELARNSQAQALLNYESTVRVALVEVSNALQGYDSATRILGTTEQLMQSTRAYLRLAQLQYGEGVLGYLDVLDAQRQLFDAELTLSGARTIQLQALVQLYRALGGGWEPPTP
ncbi:efflux transporter outer membrane subunit [Simiduia agarivorans]|uniref:Outer membrane efflux protein n=1 Tax=Simiduia agarivorans (strain DSM 21679 / JCM 13881 / BCRC 17597 / SA1) TaxID=1117647 RepID=K4KMA0_SIMAS|nr:efflux transporter outer membrane subunit [Simiduia agarivorans]AFU99360.1 outer membrane efflux protein [Simiduia agarivorans SA1 = DSM 21679]